MALTHSEKTVSSLKINKVPSKAVYQKMIDQGLINNDELYLVTQKNKIGTTEDMVVKIGKTDNERL